jgi:hypothetical protein
MHEGKFLFAQLLLYAPFITSRRRVAEHRGEHKVNDFSCLDQFFAMAFAQLTYRESLRDIEGNLRAQARRLYHMGFRCQAISRNTLANANAMYPVAIGIKRMISDGDAQTEWNIVMATALQAMVPPALVVMLMQKWFFKGLVDTEK